jgi:hypothetical protein
MPDVIVDLVACLLVGLAVAIQLGRRYDPNWAAKDLRHLDVRVLAEIAGGRRFGVAPDRLARLSKREFIVEEPWGGCRITPKGRYAVFVVRCRAAFGFAAKPSRGSPA